MGTVGGHRADNRDSQQRGEQGQRPERTTPTNQQAAERTERDAEESGEHSAAEHNPKRPRARRRADDPRRHDGGHSPERAGRERRQPPRGEQNPEAVGESDRRARPRTPAAPA